MNPLEKFHGDSITFLPIWILYLIFYNISISAPRVMSQIYIFIDISFGCGFARVGLRVSALHNTPVIRLQSYVNVRKRPTPSDLHTEACLTLLLTLRWLKYQCLNHIARICEIN